MAFRRAAHWIMILLVAAAACTTEPGSPAFAEFDPPVLIANPGAGYGKDTTAVTIVNSGTGELKDLTISFPDGAPAWLTATLDRTKAPATLYLIATAGSLELGSYTTTLQLSAKGVAPITFVVKFTVTTSINYWVSPKNLFLIPGETRRTEVWRINTSTKTYALHDSTLWTSANPSVATVSNTGVVTGVSAGTTTITSPFGSTSVTVRTYTGLQFKQVIAAKGRVCALTTAGAVYCWGEVGNWGLSGLDGSGGTQLDLGSSAFEKTEIPVLAVGGPGGHLSSIVAQYVASPQLIDAPAFTSIGAGDRETCGITSAGQTYCWGVSYILGGSTIATPQPAALPVTAASIAPPCLLTTAATVWCYAQTAVAFGTSATRTAVTREFSTPATWLSLGSTDEVKRATCGVGGDGKGYCWGYQCLGNLGVGPDGTGPTSCKAENSPQLVSSSPTFSALVNSCGLSSGGLYCTGPAPDTTRPQALTTTMAKVADVPDFVSIASGTGRCALTAAGENYCWGGGVLALGASSLTTAATAVRAEPALALSSVTSGASQYGVSCGIGTDQLLYCWGNRFTGDGIAPGVVGGFSPIPTKVRVVRIGGPAPGVLVIR